MNLSISETIAPKSHQSPPLISVIVPCYNHGVYLYECLNSITGQTYHPLEIIVVDDGSEDPYTREVLEVLGRDKRLTVIRQPNRGPSVARNRAISLATGRYILPVDADNYLAPDAIESLYEVLRTAPDDVKFVYQNQQFFGNRTDYAIQPSYNLYSLLQDNYCDTCALIDRSVFDEGIHFREEIGLGHEDWDFFLQLAGRGYVGRPCPTRSLFYRKQGFTRSDSVTFNFGRFQERMRELHPDLYRSDRLLAIKRRWSPALSVVLDWDEAPEPETLRCLIARLKAQTCLDFELVAPDYLADAIRESAVGGDAAPSIARVAIVGGEDDDGAMMRARRLRALLEKARGKYFLLWANPATEPFGDTACIEKAVRLIESSWSSHCVVLLAAAEGTNRTGWKPITVDVGEALGEHPCLGLLVRANALVRDHAEVDLDRNANIYAGIVTYFLRRAERDGTCVQWRTLNVAALPTVVDRAVYVPFIDSLPPDDRTVATDGAEADGLFPLFGADFFANASDEIEFGQRMSTRPMFIQTDTIIRQPVLRAEQRQSPLDPFHHEFWRGWQPENTTPLSLVHQPHSNIYHLTTNPHEYHIHGFYTVATLGRVYTQQFVGTVPLIRVIDPKTVQSTCTTEPVPADAHPMYLGFVSTSPLAGMLGLLQMVHLRTKQRIFTTNVAQAIADGFQFETFLGFLEPLELEPRTVEQSASCGAGERKTGDDPWTLYETEISAAGDFVYTLHPDLALLSGASVRSVGQIHTSATVERLPLYKLVNPKTDRHIYRTRLSTEIDTGFQLEGIIGYIPVVAHAHETPLYLYDIAGANRMRGVGTMHAINGYLLVGIIGCTRPAPENRAPLYRWYHPREDRWAYSTTEEEDQRIAEGYQLEGVLGLAYLSDEKEFGLIALSETHSRRSEHATYGVGPTNAMRPDIAREQVIAYLSAAQESHSIPLFRLHDAASGRYLYTVNPDEKSADGFVTETIVGYLDAAVPPFGDEAFFAERPGLRRIRSSRPGDKDPIIHGLVFTEQQADTIPLLCITQDDASEGWEYTIAPDEECDAEVVGFIPTGPTPGALPLYRYIHGTSQRTLLSTNPRLIAEGYLIQSIAGFLPAFEESTARLPGEGGHVEIGTAPLESKARLLYLESVVIPTKNEHITSLESYVRRLEGSRIVRGLGILASVRGRGGRFIARLREAVRVVRS
ncbi:MAG: glycosyltransferase family 2 protein [Thermomicrobiales bacterium]